jgi:hypothetical protein
VELATSTGNHSKQIRHGGDEAFLYTCSFYHAAPRAEMRLAHQPQNQSISLAEWPNLIPSGLLISIPFTGTIVAAAFYVS